jgi:hypothetical protein
LEPDLRLAVIKYLPVVVTLALMGALAADTLSHPKATDAEPYHRRVLEASQAIPMQIGNWHGEDHPADAGAVAMLHNPVIVQRTYTNSKTGETAAFLLVHCRDTRDINGHFPPFCYPSQGYDSNRPDPIALDVGGRHIDGMEYHFSKVANGRPTEIAVESLIILPDGTFVRNADDVGSVAKDNLRFFYGAGQIQVVMDANIPADERMKIFKEIMEANLPMLDALCSGGAR